MQRTPGPPDRGPIGYAIWHLSSILDADSAPCVSTALEREPDSAPHRTPSAYMSELSAHGWSDIKDTRAARRRWESRSMRECDGDKLHASQARSTKYMANSDSTLGTPISPRLIMRSIERGPTSRLRDSETERPLSQPCRPQRWGCKKSRDSTKAPMTAWSMTILTSCRFLFPWRIWFGHYTICPVFWGLTLSVSWSGAWRLSSWRRAENKFNPGRHRETHPGKQPARHPRIQESMNSSLECNHELFLMRSFFWDKFGSTCDSRINCQVGESCQCR